MTDNQNQETPFERHPINSPDHSEMVRVRKGGKKNKRKQHRKHVIIVIAIVVAVLLLVVGGIALATQIGKKNLLGNNTKQESNVSYSEGNTIDYNGHTYALNENIISLCFMGFDRTTVPEDSSLHGQADAVIVATLDTSTGAMKLISIPRDSMVDVGVYTEDGTYLRTEKKQICLAFGYGDGGDISCKNVMTSASRTLNNMPINYYFALDEQGVGALADAIDGVPLTALQSIPDTNITQGKDVILYDSNALAYVQYRDTSQLDSSLDRQARQIQFVKAFASKAMGNAKGNANNLLKLYQEAGDYSITNLGTNEFLYLASNITSNNVTSVSMTSLQGTMTQGSAYAEYNLDENSVYQTVLDVYYTQVS